MSPSPVQADVPGSAPVPVAAVASPQTASASPQTTGQPLGHFSFHQFIDGLLHGGHLPMVLKVAHDVEGTIAHVPHEKKVLVIEAIVRTVLEIGELIPEPHVQALIALAVKLLPIFDKNLVPTAAAK